MKSNEKRISVKDTSKILDVSEQFIRIGLQNQRLPFGTAVRTSTEWTYHISKKQLEDYVGKEVVEKYLNCME